MKQVLSYVRALLIEPFVFLFFLLTYLFPLRNRPHRAVDTQPIILIHGYLHNSSAWRWIRYELERDGYGPVYVVELKSIFNSIEDSASVVDRLIDEIRAETGANKVQLVGHSLGGLVATWVASYRPHHVSMVITIGSPLEGTRLAAPMQCTCGKQMKIGAPFLEALKEHAETLTMVPFVHIASDADLIIYPHESAVPTYTPDSKRVWVDGLGHFSLLLSNRITKILKSGCSR